MQDPKIEKLLRRDPRYPIEAYEFVFHALKHAQHLLGHGKAGGRDEESHVSGPQLLLGVRDLARSEFGLMARSVFRMWGINRTDDFGDAVYDLDEALTRDYLIEVPCEAPEEA
jgi:uncharacterized repeat protein (TIGR04138 family)